MLRAESAAFSASHRFDDMALPIRPAASGAGFSSAYGSLHAEIRDTIENGFAQSSSSTLAMASLPSQLHAGGQAWLAAYLAGDHSASVHKAGSASVYTNEAQRLAFLEEIAPWAEQAGAQLGTSPHIIAAHAALESNWGLQPVKSEGRSVYNLFGIKAGKRWQGKSVSAMTVEHLDGQDVRLAQNFRAYSSYDSAFHDYTRLLKDNPRYAAALNAGHDARAFSRGLKQGGYATDAAYEDKLVNVAKQIQRMVQSGS
ncbi:glucosaminidase domain-containing protein [Dyella sp. M7H15-1]|uniref:glucosaminidase domain-containing protein n=1 Tax=Dyella sp. M7H15-1 TaxID=2501295 RepID=UPI0013E8CF8B|nr:glucosaminidase domain-containing protein [Dyella sp. M7H15-1]